MNESENNIMDYFKEIQNKLKDFRDNRGKRHELAFVILSFFIAILRSSGKLNYSVIHRSMLRDYENLKRIIGEKSMQSVSYSQIKRILSLIDYQLFNSINQNYFGRQITNTGLHWQAIDGKELRGTIDKVVGQKRSENIIQQVCHKTKQSQLIGFYNGSKESEKKVVQNFIEGFENLNGKAFSFDALHTSSGFLENISNKSGIYLAQVKENQKYLLEEVKHIHSNLPGKIQFQTTEKGHGRIENRQGFLYPLNVECLSTRWKNTDIQTLLVVDRQRFIPKTQKETNETAYFISNKRVDGKSGLELFNAAREHWSIESDNHIRDVNIGEDDIISFDKNTSRMMAVSISLALNLLRKINSKNNLKALREDISCNFNLIFSCFAPN